MNSYFVWFLVGFIQLGILTYQDFKNKNWVDSRHNYFMFGFTLGFFSELARLNFIYYIGIVFLSVLVYYIMKKTKGLSKGDNQSLSWIYLGLMYLSLNHLFCFVILLLIQIVIIKTIVFFLEKNKILIKRNFPFFLSIFISYVCTFLFFL